MDSLRTLQKQVEKETALGLSWDTVVQLLTIQGLTEVSSRLDQLNKVLAEILSDARRTEAGSSPPAPSSPVGTGGVETRVQEPRGRGRPRKGS